MAVFEGRPGFHVPAASWRTTCRWLATAMRLTTTPRATRATPERTVWPVEMVDACGWVLLN